MRVYDYFLFLKTSASYSTCVLRETSTKPLGMLTHLLTALLLSSHYLLLPTMSFSGQLFQINRSLRPSFVNWLSLSSLGPSFPPLLPVSRQISPSSSLCGFHAKTDKDILGANTNRNECHLLCHTECYLLCHSYKAVYLPFLIQSNDPLFLNYVFQ